MTVAELDVIINGRIEKLEAELATAQTKINEFSAKTQQSLGDMVDGIATKCQTLGRSLSMAVTLPLVGIGGAALKASADFGEAMAKVEGAAGAGHEEVTRLRSQVMALGGATAKSPRELADALYYVESMGYRGAAAMAVLSNSAKLSAAGMGTTTDIARTITYAVNAYGDKNLTAAKAADVFAMAVRQGAMPADALAGAIGRVLPEAARMHVSFGTLAGSISAMTKIGLNVPEAVTAMRAAFLAMDHPSTQTKKALASVGLTAQEVSEGFKKDLIGTLGVLAQASGKGGDAFARIFPNVRAFTGVLALTGEHAKTTADLIHKVEQATGTAGQVFDIASQQAGFKYKQALIEVQNALITLGDVMAPYAEKVAQAVDKGAKAFEALSPQIKQVIVVVGAVAAAIGPLLLAFGTLAKLVLTGISLYEKIGPLFTAISAAFTEGGAAAGVLGTAIEALSGPVGWVILAAGLIYAAWRNNWGNIRQFVTDTVNQIVGFWHEQLPKVSETVVSVTASVMKAWAQIRPYIIADMNVVVSILTVAWDLIKGIVQQAIVIVEGTVSVGLDILSGRWSQIWNDIAKTTQAECMAIMRMVTAMVSHVLEAVDSAINAIRGLAGAAQSQTAFGQAAQGVKLWGMQFDELGKQADKAAAKVVHAHQQMHTASGGGGGGGAPIHLGDPIGGGGKGHKGRGGGGESDAQKHLDKYREKVQELTRDILELGDKEEWEKAIIERKYGEYAEYTAKEWQVIYALIAKKERTQDHINAVQKSIEVSQKLQDALNDEVKKHLTINAATTADKVAIEQFGKTFSQVTDERHRKMIETIAKQRDQNETDEKSRALQESITKALKEKIKTLDEGIASVGKDNAVSKIATEIRDSDLKSLNIWAKTYLMALAAVREKKEADYQAEKAADTALRNAASEKIKALTQSIHLIGAETDMMKLQAELRSGDLKTLSAWAKVYILGLQQIHDANLKLYESQKTAQEDYKSYMKEVSKQLTELKGKTQELNLAQQMTTRFGVLGWQAVAAAMYKATQLDKVKQFQTLLQTVSEKFSQTFMTALDSLFTKGFKGFFGNVIGGFDKMLQQMAQQWIQSALLAAIQRGLGGSTPNTSGAGSFGGIFGGLASFLGGHRGTGGPVTGGMPYLVGEHGPELYIPNSGGQIMQNGQGMGGGTVNNITMHVHTPTPDAFRKSGSQIAREMGLASQRAVKRNG